MSEEIQKWIRVGKTIAAEVPCPRCGRANLEVEDIRAEDAPNVVMRVMRCPECGATNELRMVRPPSG